MEFMGSRTTSILVISISMILTSIAESQIKIRKSQQDPDVTIQVYEIQKLSEMLNSSASEQQSKALDRISRNTILAPYFTAKLIELSGSKDVHLRKSAMYAISALPDLDLFEECLCNGLKDADTGIRTTAIYGLMKRKTVASSTADQILWLLDHEEADLQYAALSFVSQCPEMIPRATPYLLALLDSKKMRYQSLAPDMAIQVPIAWDAARFIGAEYKKNKDEQYKSILEEIVRQSKDTRKTLIALLSLESVSAEKMSRSMDFVQKIVSEGTEENQLSVLEEISISTIEPECKIALLGRLATAKGKNGFEAAIKLIRLETYWSLEREELQRIRNDDLIPQWLKEVIDQWLIHNEPFE